MDRYIGQTVVCVGNIHQTIVDCFVLEAFREYRDDSREHEQIAIVYNLRLCFHSCRTADTVRQTCLLYQVRQWNKKHKI